ncbi:MAG: hypothetical protein ACOCRX_07765 [Candidatus Woesearchaeota archaeon]
MKQEEDSIEITFETLYEILRLEKSNPDLHTLPEDFYENILKYLFQKEENLADIKKEADVFSSGEKERLQREYNSAKNMVEKIYEIREKKLVDMAINKSRMPKTVIDKRKLNDYEKEFFYGLVSYFDQFRKGILKNVISLKKPELKFTNDNRNVNSDSNENKRRKVRFKRNVPKFVWKDLSEHGPYEKNEIAILPKELAKHFVEDNLCNRF